jgi:hypothetical protein
MENWLSGSIQSKTGEESHRVRGTEGTFSFPLLHEIRLFDFFSLFSFLAAVRLERLLQNWGHGPLLPLSCRFRLLDIGLLDRVFQQSSHHHSQLSFLRCNKRV